MIKKYVFFIILKPFSSFNINTQQISHASLDKKCFGYPLFLHKIQFLLKHKVDTEDTLQRLQYRLFKWWWLLRASSPKNDEVMNDNDIGVIFSVILTNFKLSQPHIPWSVVRKRDPFWPVTSFSKGQKFGTHIVSIIHKVLL